MDSSLRWNDRQGVGLRLSGERRNPDDLLRSLVILIETTGFQLPLE